MKKAENRRTAAIAGENSQNKAVINEEERMADILNELENYIAQDNPKKWAKLASQVGYRRLHLALLADILKELRRLNKKRAPNR
jgi:hypothetical protein